MISLIAGRMPAGGRLAPKLIGPRRVGRDRLGLVTRLRDTFALRGLAAPERFGDELVGQNEPRLLHVADVQNGLRAIIRRRIVAADARGVACGPEQDAAK